MPPTIEIVVAAARNRVIGRGNALPWRISSDLKHFRRLTMGRPILMGRRTFESVGRPLDGRTNIVVTRDPLWRAEGVVVARSLSEALTLGRDIALRDGVDAVMVTGGAQIYAEALPRTGRVHLTEIALEPEGDATFPALDPAEWRLAARVQGERGPRDEADFAFLTYERRR